MLFAMRNRDWVEFLDTLGHDPALLFSLAAGPAATMEASPFVFVGDDLEAGTSRDLLFKMISAMGIRPDQVRITSLQDYASSMAAAGRQ